MSADNGTGVLRIYVTGSCEGLPDMDRVARLQRPPLSVGLTKALPGQSEHLAGLRSRRCCFPGTSQGKDDADRGNCVWVSHGGVRRGKPLPERSYYQLGLREARSEYPDRRSPDRYRCGEGCIPQRRHQIPNMKRYCA